MQRLWTSTLVKPLIRQSVYPCRCHVQNRSTLIWQFHIKPASILSAAHLKCREFQTSSANLSSDGREGKIRHSVQRPKDPDLTDGMHSSRLHRTRSADARRYQTQRSHRKFVHKDRDIEDRYMQDYARTKRYTKRPRDHGGDGETTTEVRENDGKADRETEEADTFGNLTNQFDAMKRWDVGTKYDDEPDSDGENWIRPRGRPNQPYWFGTQMKKLCKQGKLKEAIEMLQIRMLKEERVKPIAYNYNILIGACGRAGYTKMAFKLYNDMKKRGIQPQDVTYTTLINACAESPWPTMDGIARLRKLHSQMQEKNVNINYITHHALMKAYAKCGDVHMTFDLFRHLLACSRHVTAESCNFFFFACASLKKEGLTYAIQGWRYMRQRGIKLDTYSYNLLLRIARDCGIGDVEVANRVLLQRGQSDELLQLPASPAAVSKKSRKRAKKAAMTFNPEWERITLMPINPILDENDENEEYEFLDIDEVTRDSKQKGDEHTFWWQEEQSGNRHTSHNAPHITSVVKSPTMQTVEETRNLPVSPRKNVPVPDLLNSSQTDLQHIVALGSIDTPKDRLALIGGCEGVLKNMAEDDIKPDIKTFGLLSEMIPRTTAAENELLVAMDAAGVKGDLDLYNGLIGNRAIRRDLEGAKDMLTKLHDKGLFPSMQTYGNLSKGCYKHQDGIQLLQDIKAAGQQPNIYIFSSLISAANKSKNYGYLSKLLDLMLEYNVRPSQQLIEKLENIASFHQDKANKAQRNSSKHGTEQNDKQLNYFRSRYITWLDNINMADEEHPWDKYKPAKYRVNNDRDR